MLTCQHPGTSRRFRSRYSSICLLHAYVFAIAAHADVSASGDQSPIQITEKTPLDRVIEMFRALGMRLPAWRVWGEASGIPMLL